MICTGVAPPPPPLEAPVQVPRISASAVLPANQEKPIILPSRDIRWGVELVLVDSMRQAVSSVFGVVKLGKAVCVAVWLAAHQ